MSSRDDVRERQTRARHFRARPTQAELLDRQRWRTRIELANAMFDHLEIFDNRRRRHSARGWLTPLEIENRTSITVA